MKIPIYTLTNESWSEGLYSLELVLSRVSSSQVSSTVSPVEILERSDSINCDSINFFDKIEMTKLKCHKYAICWAHFREKLSTVKWDLKRWWLDVLSWWFNCTRFYLLYLGMAVLWTKSRYFWNLVPTLSSSNILTS